MRCIVCLSTVQMMRTNLNAYESLILVRLVVEKSKGQDNDNEESRGHVYDVPKDSHVNI